jgi:hypothetical protein
MGRTKKLTAQEIHPDATAIADAPPTALYWCGMLPAQGTFKLKKPTREKDSQTNDYFTWIDVTSQELWESEVNQWVGRCRWKQSLSVNGFSFDAFTETLMRQVGTPGDNLSRHSWPGAIIELDEDRFKHIVEQCYRNVIRLKNGMGHEICIDQPKSYMMRQDGSETSIKEGYNSRTDTFVAHYVYAMKVDVDPQQFDRDTYYRLAFAWDEFFKTPPQSVAEMYPLKDGKVQFTAQSEGA